MDKKFVDILQQLVEDLKKESKIDKFLTTSTCKSYLDDYTRGDFKTEKKFLLRVLEEGVAKEIYNTSDLVNCKRKQIRVLVEAIYPEDASIEIVDILAMLLRGDTTKTVKQHDTIIVKPKEKTFITFGKYQWRVLKTQNDRTLIITKDIIYQMRFHCSSNNYSDSEVRKYLINDFYNTFSKQEKMRILQDPETKDNIFLLSEEQAKNYFTSDKDREATYNGTASIWWLRLPGIFGDYAYAAGFSVGVSIGGYFVHYDHGGVRPALWLQL